MSIGKDLFMRAHEQAIEAYQEAHPNADWSEAYERTGDAAMAIQREMVEDLYDAADALRKAQREQSK